MSQLLEAWSSSQAPYHYVGPSGLTYMLAPIDANPCPLLVYKFRNPGCSTVMCVVLVAFSDWLLACTWYPIHRKPNSSIELTFIIFRVAGSLNKTSLLLNFSDPSPHKKNRRTTPSRQLTLIRQMTLSHLWRNYTLLDSYTLV